MNEIIEKEINVEDMVYEINDKDYLKIILKTIEI